jgi:hypothetical protein
MNIKAYIESGILESYMLGLATDEEVHELMLVKRNYPKVRQALAELEDDMERIAANMAISPPPGTWEKIEETINEELTVHALKHLTTEKANGHNGRKPNGSAEQFIEVEAESRYFRVHQNWTWIFVVVFVLGKIFLACAIYFYLENRQAQQQIRELKSELHQQQHLLP